MDKRFLTLLLFFLSIILIISGNYIHILQTRKSIDYLNTYVKTKNKFTILIEVDKKQLSLVDRENESIVKTYPIATGKPGSPTPLGTFSVVEKAKWGEGFGTRWLGLDVPWGKYGIHGTNKPGSIGGNLSGGCVRMQNRNVEELYDYVEVGTLVIITNGPYGPFGYGFRNLRPGHRGSDVLEVQKKLSTKGYYEGTLDGIYGEGMKAALIKFLKDEKVPLTDEISSEIYKKMGIVLME